MGLSYKQGSGSGSVTYSIGGNPDKQAAASATTTSYYNSDVLYSVILNLTFTDSSQGTVVIMLIVNPFAGTGVYDSSNQQQTLTIMFSTTVAGNGNWGNPSGSGAVVVLDAIYNESNSVTQWQGSMKATGLAWTGSPSEPTTSVHLSALTLTINQTSAGESFAGEAY